MQMRCSEKQTPSALTSYFKNAFCKKNDSTASNAGKNKWIFTSVPLSYHVAACAQELIYFHYKFILNVFSLLIYIRMVITMKQR